MLGPKVIWLVSGRLGSNSSTSVSGLEQERECMYSMAHWPLGSDPGCASKWVPRRVLMEAASSLFSSSAGLSSPWHLRPPKSLVIKDTGVQRQAPFPGEEVQGDEGSIGLGRPPHLLKIVRLHCD